MLDLGASSFGNSKLIYIKKNICKHTHIHTRMKKGMLWRNRKRKHRRRVWGRQWLQREREGRKSMIDYKYPVVFLYKKKSSAFKRPMKNLVCFHLWDIPHLYCIFASCQVFLIYYLNRLGIWFLPWVRVQENMLVLPGAVTQS